LAGDEARCWFVGFFSVVGIYLLLTVLFTDFIKLQFCRSLELAINGGTQEK